MINSSKKQSWSLLWNKYLRQLSQFCIYFKLLGLLGCLKWDGREHCQTAIWKHISSPYRELLQYNYYLFPLNVEFGLFRTPISLGSDNHCRTPVSSSKVVMPWFVQSRMPAFSDTFHIFLLFFTKAAFYLFVYLYSLDQMYYCITIFSALTCLLLLSLAMREKKRALHIFCVRLIQEIIIIKKNLLQFLHSSYQILGMELQFPFLITQIRCKTRQLNNHYRRYLGSPTDTRLPCHGSFFLFDI